jgi:hypothetical protein
LNTINTEKKEKGQKTGGTPENKEVEVQKVNVNNFL